MFYLFHGRYFFRYNQKLYLTTMKRNFWAHTANHLSPWQRHYLFVKKYNCRNKNYLTFTFSPFYYIVYKQYKYSKHQLLLKKLYYSSDVETIYFKKLEYTKVQDISSTIATFSRKKKKLKLNTVLPWLI